MKTFRNLLLAGLAAAALFSFQPVAHANSIVLCAPEVSGASAGPRRVTNPGTSGGSYQLDGSGCAVMSTSNADVAYFLSQGFSQSGPLRAIIFNTGVATGTTDFIIGSIPAQAFIQDIIFSNSVAAAVTGGVSIGTTANGVDVVAAQACASTCLTFTTDALLLKRPFSLTAATPLHAAAVTAWNSTNLTITVIYGYF